MSAPHTAIAAPTRRRTFLQVLTGLVVLPLSVGPFLAYGLFTPEGRSLRDRLIVAVAPPELPDLSLARQQDAAAMGLRYQGKVMPLVYQGVGSRSDAEAGFVVSPRRFAEHLATLRAAGMVTVTAQDVARAFGGGAPLPDNAVMITFDDTRPDALLFADPLLEQAGMRATMFVSSSAIDQENFSSAGWDSIEKAARSGRWDIGAQADGLQAGEPLTAYQARIRGDLDRNLAAIEAHVGHRPVAFAYPFGASGADSINDPAIRDILREEIAARYAIAFHQDDQASVPLLDPGQDRFGLRRLEVGNWSGPDLLARIRDAAGPADAPVDPAEPSDAGLTELELVAPPPPPEPTTTTTLAQPVQGGRPEGSRPTGKVREPSRPAKPSVSTTSTAPPTTSTTHAPGTTTTSTVPPTTSSSTTTTTTRWWKRPTTTTTTRPTTTTTTRPSSDTTTTTTTEDEDRCRGRDDRHCRR